MKIASFTFDDGYINTARKIKEVEIPATFYLVTGWLDGSVEILDEFNKFHDHGSIKDWKEIGFDIGCHTHTHNRCIDEIQSISNFKLIFDTKYYNLATPYGLPFKSLYFNTCKVGYYKPYNQLCKKNYKYLSSININFDIEEKKLENLIRDCPDEHWIIFTFHGIDEGWLPTSLFKIKELFKMLNDNDFKIKTISEVLHETGTCSNLLQ